MQKEEKSTESVLVLSMNAHSLLEQHYEEFLNELAKHVDQEFMEQDEKNWRPFFILVQGGILFGDENMDMSHEEIENREDDLWVVAKSLIEKYHYPSLEVLEGKEDTYTKVFLNSIYSGQKNSGVKIEIQL